MTPANKLNRLKEIKKANHRGKQGRSLEPAVIASAITLVKLLDGLTPKNFKYKRKYEQFNRQRNKQTMHSTT